MKNVYEIINEIRAYAKEEKVPIMMDDGLKFLIEYIAKNKIQSVLEIGTAIGFSAICFSKFLVNDGRIDTIEIESIRVQQALENIEKVGVQDKIRVLEGDALEILPYLTEEYDVVFIDAAKGKYLEFFLNN